MSLPRDAMEPPSPSKQPSEIKVGKTRTIILWIFVIVFWLFFYWYKGNRPPEKADPPKIEQNAAPSGKNGFGIPDKKP